MKKLELERKFSELQAENEERALNIIRKYDSKAKPEDIAPTYAAYLYAMSHREGKSADELFDILIDNNKIHWPAAWDISYFAVNNLSELDHDFHFVHRLLPQIRKEAIQLLSEYGGTETVRFTNIMVRDHNGRYLGFPQDTIEKIKSSVRHLDVALRFSESYFRTHIDWANGSRDEYLVIQIFAIDEETLEMANKIIEGVIK